MAEPVSTQCPVCGAWNPNDEHLIWEYKDMMSARFGMFGRNAAAAQDKVAEMLLDHGITSIPNIFGNIPIQREERAS